MSMGRTRTRPVETGRAPPHPVQVLEDLERSFPNSRQWQEAFLGYRPFV